MLNLWGHTGKSLGTGEMRSSPLHREQPSLDHLFSVALEVNTKIDEGKDQVEDLQNFFKKPRLSESG